MDNNNEKKWIVTKKNFFALLALFPIACLAKVYQYTMTSNLNFGIMTYIKNIVDTESYMGIKSYDFPARIYSAFKFLGFETHLEWSIFITVIFTCILFAILLLRYKEFSVKQYIYIYASAFIMIWTVFNMNKDLIQFIFLLIIYIIMKKKWGTTKKITLTVGVVVIEAIFFREYYIILAGLSIICYYSLSRAFKEKRKKYNWIMQILIILAFFYVAIFVMKFIWSDAYDSLINRRDSLQSLDDVTTIINNKIKGSSYKVFMGNYIINFFRVSFPIELVKFGPKQWIFLIYQLVNTCTLICSIKKMNKKNVLWVSFVLAYTMMLVASESDFGTLARHQSVLLLFYIELFKNMKERNNITNNEIQN